MKNFCVNNWFIGLYLSVCDVEVIISDELIYR